MITLNDATIEKRFEELSKIAGRDTASLMTEVITTKKSLDELETLYSCIEILNDKDAKLMSLEEVRRALDLEN
jgi:predicted DNA-binding protein